jgi:hypothetical protein
MMVSFQQQWEAAMTAQDRGRRSRSPLRHAALLLVVALVLITAPTIALARATGSHAKVHGCRVVHVAPASPGGRVACR